MMELNSQELNINENINSVYSISLKEDININVSKDLKAELYILINVIENKTINVNIKENAILKLVLVCTGINGYNLNVNLDNDSYLDLYTGDSISNDIEINKTINLLGVNSSYKGYEYLASRNNKITGKFIVNHKNISTKANGKFIYLSRDNGYINRDVISKIDKGMKDSDSSENIKGVILDSESRIDAKPVLVIDYDDVHAAHGCAIGTIDENEVYYLMSRGLTKEDALKIICRSLVNPIIKEIKDEELLNKVKPMLDSTIGE